MFWWLGNTPCGNGVVSEKEHTNGSTEENNTSHYKNKRKYLGTLPNLPVPPKRKKLSGRVGKGNESCINIPKNLNIATNLCKDFHNEIIAFKNEKIVD